MNLTALDPFPTLQTERLTLRAFTIDDAPQLFLIRSSPLAMQYMDSTPFTELAQAEKFTLEKIKDRTEKKGISWAITLKGNDKLIGDIAYWSISAKNHRAEVGYSLLPQHWGKGYMSEALRAVIDWGFEKLALHSIEADINPHNTASRKLLLKMGFKKEGYFNEDYYFDGKFLDSELYGLLKPDFYTIQQSASDRQDPTHRSYMTQCISLGKIAGENKEPPVGSILVHGTKVIGQGLENVKASQDVTGHAEMLAIRDAINKGHIDKLSSAIMYTTHEPCIMCTYAIRTHKIPKIIYGLDVPHIGAATSTFQVLNSKHVPYWEVVPEVISGVMKEECMELDKKYR